MDSFEQIYSAFAKDVYRFALSLCSNPTVAEDITQETFYKALRGASRFRGDCQVSVTGRTFWADFGLFATN